MGKEEGGIGWGSKPAAWQQNKLATERHRKMARTLDKAIKLFEEMHDSAYEMRNHLNDLDERIRRQGDSPQLVRQYQDIQKQLDRLLKGIRDCGLAEQIEKSQAELSGG